MQPDPEYLSRHYRSLSDDALLAIDRDDLVAVAQSCYDAEVKSRGLAASFPEPGAMPPEEWAGAEDDGEPPEWLEEGAEVYSALMDCRHRGDDRMADARHILASAGIPCYLDQIELEPERPVTATHRWRLMVPPNYEWRAMSTLERDLSNADFEEAWRSFLEECPDGELPSMNPQVVFCGLFDRVERVTRVYREELARRKR